MSRLSRCSPSGTLKGWHSSCRRSNYILILVEHPDVIAKSMGYDGPIFIDYEATLAVLHRETSIKMLINSQSTDKRPLLLRLHYGW